MDKNDLKKIKKNIYEFPKSGKMRVPGRIFISEDLFVDDKALDQVKNVAQLPGILKYSIGLTDMHVGYGFPIGGVAAFDIKKGIICPGGIGYDINCSVRLLKTNLTKEDILKKQKEVVEGLYRKIPSGVGRGSPFQINYKELDSLLKGGAKYMVEKGYGIKRDYLYSEEEGCMKDADPSKVSKKAKMRGIGQIGTIGAGNHFLEVQFVEKVFDKKIAKDFGLKVGQVVVMIHCGSRGLGHQVASDYIKLMEEKYGYDGLPDRELINAPIKSKLGKDYFEAMSATANFAFANKQLITHWVREELTNLYGNNTKVEVLYDVCHNIAKIEEYTVDGKKVKVCVHRKGATRSYGKGRKEIPKEYRNSGQPVLIPGSMGTASYVLVGQKKSEEITFGSTVHGAGRVMSRSLAMKNISGSKIKKDLEGLGIKVGSGSEKGLAQEAPEVYKDIDEVVKIVDELGISKKVARMKPLVVIKG
ncbi:MAG: RtcB family protein [Nanoarchaeota archaeon]|nr:RtcB family protein [Nanoarchaeota archaeon]